MKKNKLLVLILDGWGYRVEKENNAIAMAKKPNFDKAWNTYPHAILEAAGEAVGLPKGQMGTSEVNHMIIGAGRVIFQYLEKINKSIEDKTFFTNPVFLNAFNFVKIHNSILHIKGLVSPGGVHSHQNHLYALLEAAKTNGVKNVHIHVFTDGRDTLPKSALEYIEALEEKIKELGIGKIASVSGRYYAMDRDNNWDRTDKTYHMLTRRGQSSVYKTAKELIEKSYEKNITDEFIEPAKVQLNESGEESYVNSEDTVVFINFRNDRTRQLTERFLTNGPRNIKYLSMTTYDPRYNVEVAYPIEDIKETMGEVLSRNKIKQLRIAETEKFAHLTFFMNCKRELAFEGEDRMMLDSYSDIKNHDERPEMRTPDVTREIIQDMDSKGHQIILTNICNCDMVGHTGNLHATIKGIEVIDKSLGDLFTSAKKNGYDVIITADHGNAEVMYDNVAKQSVTSHTTSPVPFILVSDKYKALKSDKGSLGDMAPTILNLLGLPIPGVMTCKSLV